MGRIAIVLCYLFANCAFAQDIYESFQVKWGEVARSEQWQGRILIIGDVRIRNDVTVTVMPDTWIVYSDYDVENLGADETKPELIVDGTLHTAKGEAPKILTMHDPLVKPFIDDASSTRKIEIAAQQVDVTPLYSQWRDYGIHYAYIWAILYSLWLVF